MELQLNYCYYINIQDSSGGQQAKMTKARNCAISYNVYNTQTSTLLMALNGLDLQHV